MSSNSRKNDKKSNGQVNGSTKNKSQTNSKTTTKIGKVPVDLKNPEPQVDPEKVEAFRRIVSAEDFEELDDNHGNSNGPNLFYPICGFLILCDFFSELFRTF